MELISVVVPAFNEEEVINAFYTRLGNVLDSLDKYDSEIVIVNDGSHDNTLNIVQEIAQRDPRVSILNLSRNYGKEIALSAGLDFAKGDYIVPIDADLQDPPELIVELLNKIGEGFDVVYATRRQRHGETKIKKITAEYFYKVIGALNDKVQVPANTGDFRILNRKALRALCEMREHHRFMKGLFAFIGYRQTGIFYDRDPRFAGNTKWNYWKLWNFSLEGITSFTIAPLKLATYIGFLISCGAFCYAAWVILKTLMFGDPVSGYPSLMAVILFLGGIQLITIGLIGEYLGRLFNESKQRPLYFVDNYHPSHFKDNFSYQNRLRELTKIERAN